MADPREPLGRVVRETWVAWAREQSDPKPSWLTGWDELDAGQREVDMRIGAAVAAAELRHIRELQRQVRMAQVAAERRNKEVDALHYVWCNGGCSGGVHRWSDARITAELVEIAERNTKRLRTWYRIAQFRMRLPGGGRWERERQERLAAKTDIPLPSDAEASSG